MLSSKKLKLKLKLIAISKEEFFEVMELKERRKVNCEKRMSSVNMVER